MLKWGKYGTEISKVKGLDSSGNAISWSLTPIIRNTSLHFIPSLDSDLLNLKQIVSGETFPAILHDWLISAYYIVKSSADVPLTVLTKNTPTI